ncbi:MAG: M23 family metallopeptidase, partial [Thermacetogeniaceae bacterium]
REVVYRLVRENGRVVSRQVVSSRVLKEPVSRIVARGTSGRRYYASAYSVSRGTGSGVLSWPVGGSISSGYGYRGREFHTGIDIVAGRGTPVHAAAGGRVVEAGWGGGYGNTVVIDHGNGLATRYAHLSSISVSVGETVGSGEVIGRVGSTGRATGPHLHFEVMVNGSRVNPLNYLR